MHSYVWNDLDAVPSSVPANLSVPFVAVCNRLGFARGPVHTHTGADLWNWKNAGAVESGDLEGIELISTFSNSRDEVGE